MTGNYCCLIAAGMALTIFLGLIIVTALSHLSAHRRRRRRRDAET